MIELHLHLDGSLNAEDIITLSKLSGTPLPTKDKNELKPLLTADKNCKSLAEYLMRFKLPLTVLQTEENIKTAVFLLLKRLWGQGIIYAEIRFAPQLHQSGGLSQKQVVAAAVKGLTEAKNQTGITAALILCCMRNGTAKNNEETLLVAEQYLNQGVCAIDLAGDEAANPTAQFSPLFERAKNLHIPFTIHAGEAAGADSVLAAVNMGAQRIGHGVQAVKDEKVLALLKAHNITLETCFTSNLQTKAVAAAEDYPLPLFLKCGIPATIATDNATVSGTDLKNEYRLIKKQFSLDNSTLLTACLNAAEGAFTDEITKNRLKKQVINRFESWLIN